MPQGSPSLGEMIAQGKTNLQAPWLGLTAFFAMSIMLSLLIFIGEAVRHAEAEEIERGQRRDRTGEDERQEGQRRDHRVRQQVAP
ncbi:hypothetical protein ACC738_38190, partial [Rhizobium ruizarguesonis]